MALLIKVQDEVPRRPSTASRGFIFEEMWLKHEGYEEMIKNAWAKCDVGDRGISGLWRQLHDVSAEIKHWSFESFGSIRAEIKRLCSQLEMARSVARSHGTSQEVKKIESKLHEIFEREKIMYRQRSRQEWLKAGDKNTRYFQNRASHRRRKNMVLGLRRENGNLCKTNEGMGQMAHNFFHTLYSSEGSNGGAEITDLVEEM
jgi:hypothetical protein